MDRSINSIHTAVPSHIGELITYRALPTSALDMDSLDPFLFLNHHGPQKYPANNNGLPFGPHPHKGFETVTFIIEGDIKHRDSSGFESVIEKGGIQWMTAGKGIVHSEESSEKFIKEGGPLEILQLWVNLPSNMKSIEPSYQGLQAQDIPVISLNEKVDLKLIAGSYDGVTGAAKSIYNLFMSTVSIKKGGSFSMDFSEDQRIFFYVISGQLSVNDQKVKKLNLIEFDQQGTTVKVNASEDSLIILGSGFPTNEPIAAQGPFVMNSEAELRQAFMEYQRGEYGML